MSEEVDQLNLRMARMEQMLASYKKKKKSKHSRGKRHHKGRSHRKRRSQRGSSTDRSSSSSESSSDHHSKKRRRRENAPVEQSDDDDSDESVREILSENDPVLGSENISPNVNPDVGKPAEEMREGALPEDILNVLGKRLYEDRASAPEVHADLAIRWNEILEKGIPSEFIHDILKKYPPPKNCALFEPPKLNPVVKAIMSEQVVARDDRIALRQGKISAALSAISNALTTVFATKNIPEWKTLAENLSDASKIMTDLQHDETVIRRTLILANVDASMRETLKESKIDEYLFGHGLEDSVKNVKALQVTSRDLKKTPGRATKNFRAPQRLQQRNQKKFSASGAKKQQHQSSSKKQSQHFKSRDQKEKESRSSRSSRR
ncbi:hypothetical protein DMENIID0001_056410 [Sergentomyia squamirostris]